MSKINKHPLNAEGKYYVDYDVCLSCWDCIEAAPGNFKIDEELVAYVFKQPTTPEEEKLCRQAMRWCPLEAIGDDGELIK